MAALLVVESKYVEEEGLDVVVQRLVVEEQLGQQAQVLTVDLADVAVHLEHGDATAAVDLVGRWVLQATLLLQKHTQTHI